MTPEQRELLRLKEEDQLTRSEIAERMGISPKAVKGRLERARIAKAKWDAAPEGIRTAMERTGLDLVGSKHGWRILDDPETGERNSVFWTNQPDPEALLTRIEEAFQSLPPAVVSDPAPRHMVQDDLCLVLPIMDLHLGMRADRRETGHADYDVKKAVADMKRSVDTVLSRVPSSAHGVLIFGGDTLHADDDLAQTPGSKHALDVDGRPDYVADEAVELCAWVTERFAQWVDTLDVWVKRGNHDPNAHRILRQGLLQRYRATDRITVSTGRREVSWLQWGITGLFSYHGDKGKPERVVGGLSDICPFWSHVYHRVILSGHVHHTQVKDIAGAQWESLRPFCPPDAWASGHMFMGRRALQVLALDKRDGVVTRSIDPVIRDDELAEWKAERGLG